MNKIRFLIFFETSEIFFLGFVHILDIFICLALLTLNAYLVRNAEISPLWGYASIALFTFCFLVVVMDAMFLYMTKRIHRQIGLAYFVARLALYTGVAVWFGVKNWQRLITIPEMAVTELLIHGVTVVAFGAFIFFNLSWSFAVRGIIVRKALESQRNLELSLVVGGDQKAQGGEANQTRDGITSIQN